MVMTWRKSTLKIFARELSVMLYRTEEQTDVTSCDGDLGLVKVMADPRRIEMERQMKIATFKHNPARTTSE
jgi:hypothetical protein